MNEPHIRWLIRRDMPVVLKIEETCFGWEAWDEEEFTRHLRQRNVIGMVAEVNDQIAGYMVYELNQNDIQLPSIAVDPQHQRTGIATAMINKLKSKLSPDRRHTLRAESLDSNLEAHLFFRASGMVGAVVSEDVYAFEYNLKSLANSI